MNRKKEIFIFFGPPGSGKGTLSQRCVKEFGWKQVSTGDLCRKHVAEQSPIGKQLDFAVKSGRLVSDELIISMIEDWFSKYIARVPAVILDGMPRTVLQAQGLQDLLEAKFPFVRVRMIRLCLADDAIISRLCGRCVCQNKECQAIFSMLSHTGLTPKTSMICDYCGSPLERRSDDAIDTVQARLVIYHKHEHELLQFFADGGQPIEKLHVDRPLDDVFRDFKLLIGLG